MSAAIAISKAARKNTGCTAMPNPIPRAASKVAVVGSVVVINTFFITPPFLDQRVAGAMCGDNRGLALTAQKLRARNGRQVQPTDRQIMPRTEFARRRAVSVEDAARQSSSFWCRRSFRTIISSLMRFSLRQRTNRRSWRNTTASPASFPQ